MEVLVKKLLITLKNKDYKIIGLDLKTPQGNFKKNRIFKCNLNSEQSVKRLTKK